MASTTPSARLVVLFRARLRSLNIPCPIGSTLLPRCLMAGSQSQAGAPSNSYLCRHGPMELAIYQSFSWHDRFVSLFP
jgi:hypothetical protein